MKDIKFLATEIQRVDKEKEDLDKQYCRLLWKKVYPYTRKLETIDKACRILNTYPLTVGTTQLFEKLRRIKEQLKAKAK